MTPEEYAKLLEQCRVLPSGPDYRETDYVSNLLITVLDFQAKVPGVNKAMDYYGKERWEAVRTHDDLQRLLRRYPDTKPGNDDLARYLWNNHQWTRAEFLRRLFKFFHESGISDAQGLKQWLTSADFKEDVASVSELRGTMPRKGYVRHGLGYTIFKWLQLRVGLEAVKPDLRVRRFVKRAIGRAPSEKEAAEALVSIARALKRRAHELDAAIWHAEERSN